MRVLSTLPSSTSLFRTWLGLLLAVLCRTIVAQEHRPTSDTEALRLRLTGSAVEAANALRDASPDQRAEYRNRLHIALQCCRIWRVDTDPAHTALLIDATRPTQACPQPKHPSTTTATAATPPQTKPVGTPLTVCTTYSFVIEDDDPRVGADWLADDGHHLSARVSLGNEASWDVEVLAAGSRHTRTTGLQFVFDHISIGGEWMWSTQSIDDSTTERQSAFARYRLAASETDRTGIDITYGLRYERADEPVLWGHDDHEDVLDLDAQTQRLGLEILVSARQQHWWLDLGLGLGTAETEASKAAIAALMDADCPQRLVRQGYWNLAMAAGLKLQGSWAQIMLGYRFGAEGPTPTAAEHRQSAQGLHQRYSHGPLLNLLAQF